MSAVAKTQDLLEPPVLEVDPFSDENLEDPAAFFELVRETAPIVHLAKYDIYAVGRFEELKTVMTDFERFTSAGGVGMADIRKPGAWRSPSPITEVDPPQHSAVRRALTKVISPLVIRKWHDAFAKDAEAVAERVVQKGEVEAVKEIVEAFVLKVFPDALGVDMPREHFPIIGELNFNQIGPQNERLRKSLEVVEPIAHIYAKSFEREAMLPGGFGEKIFQAEDAGDFAPGTAGAQVRSFLRAGVDTTIAGIGHTLNFLAQDPAQWEQVRADPAKVRGAFEEAIRLHSPAQCMFRTTSYDTELSGYRLEGGKKVANFIGAANRDTRKWPDAGRFDLNRGAAGVHLAFGTGHHICIGQMIARLEAESILGALARRARTLEPAGAPKYRLVNTLRTLERLPLRLVAA